jgi:hypothetical protein
MLMFSSRPTTFLLLLLNNCLMFPFLRLAQRIVQGDVPEPLLNRRVCNLSVYLVVEGYVIFLFIWLIYRKGHGF